MEHRRQIFGKFPNRAGGTSNPKVFVADFLHKTGRGGRGRGGYHFMGYRKFERKTLHIYLRGMEYRKILCKIFHKYLSSARNTVNFYMKIWHKALRCWEYRNIFCKILRKKIRYLERDHHSLFVCIISMFPKTELENQSCDQVDKQPSYPLPVLEGNNRVIHN